MSKSLQQIAEAIESALNEVASAEELSLIPEQAAEHWRMALNYFLRCVEVCGNQRESARERIRRER